jgi:autotransporter family porin
MSSRKNIVMLRIKEVIYTIPLNSKSATAAVKSLRDPRAGFLILLGALYNQTASAEDFLCSQPANFCTNEYVGTSVAPASPLLAQPSISPVYRSQAGSYLANLAANNTLFITRLHDRLGETQHSDLPESEQKVKGLWLINQGAHNRFRDNSGQLHTLSNRYVTQAGTDIGQWSIRGSDRFHLGVMAGYGSSKSRTRSQITGDETRASVSGYNVGLYGTWYANETDKSGMYLDSWAQYSWFTNTVTGKDSTSEQYKSEGLTTSAELGYTLKMGENVGKNVAYFIQPKAQVTLFGVKSSDHTQANGSQISAGPAGEQIRLGVKAFMNGYSDSDIGKERVFQSFVEANWLKNTKSVAINLDDVTVKQAGVANIAELKVGVEGQINKNLRLWGNIGQQIGDKGYSDTKAILGVKYSF